MLSVSGEAGVARWKMERTQTFVFSREQLIRPEAIPFLGWMLLSASCTFKVYPHYSDAQIFAELAHFKHFQEVSFLPGLQIISLTSPLFDILDLHPITTHLSKLPIFRDAATKWPHSSIVLEIPYITHPPTEAKISVETKTRSERSKDKVAQFLQCAPELQFY